MKIPISIQNLKFAFMDLDWTHDYSRAKVGNIFINRHGKANKVTAIAMDSAGRKEYWSHKECLATQYNEPHNMLTKSPFYAFQFKSTSIYNP